MHLDGFAGECPAGDIEFAETDCFKIESSTKHAVVASSAVLNLCATSKSNTGERNERVDLQWCGHLHSQPVVARVDHLSGQHLPAVLNPQPPAAEKLATEPLALLMRPRFHTLSSRR